MDASPASSQLRDFVAFRTDDSHIHNPTHVSQPMRILIVDNDQRSSAQVMHQLHANRGDVDDYIKCAMHGLDGLVVAEGFKPQLVIVHLGLPRRSGAYTAKLLRGRPWGRQVVIVSHSETESLDSDTAFSFDFHFFGGVEIPLLMQMYRNLAIRRARIDRTDKAGSAIGKKITESKPTRQKPLSI